MIDREKIISALENCSDPAGKCRDCPYEECERFEKSVSEYPDELIRKAVELLKEQEPRVLSANEIIKTTEVTTCYLEVKGERNLYGAYLQKYDDDHTLVVTDVKDVPEMIATRHARLWSSKPTDEQREAVPWGD